MTIEETKKYADMDDAQLIELSKKDVESFALIMDKYAQPLRRYIRRIANFTEDDVEDFLQEVFIKAYENLNYYEKDLKFSSWLYRVAHNKVVDEVRKKYRKTSENYLDDEQWLKIVSDEESQNKLLADKECYLKIKDVISALPLKYREVLVLRFLEDKEYEEIMDILKKPKGTVATLIARGKEMVKKELKQRSVECF